MKTIIYKNLSAKEKIEKFGVGAWVKEPDKMQWQDKTTGLPCLAVRNEMGFWCGYVGVAKGHPAFKKHYDDVDVSAHGGLTFSDFCLKHRPENESVCHIPDKGEPDKVWWLGFDCGHWRDLMPQMKKMYPEFHKDRDETYRTLNYVKRQAKKLAEQLHAMAKTTKEEVKCTKRSNAKALTA